MAKERRGKPVRVPYTKVRNGRRFFEPTPAMRRFGFAPTPLGIDDEQARRQGWALYEQWLQGRRSGASTAPTGTPVSREGLTIAKGYPRGSIGAAWQEWITTPEWERLAPSTRTKICWEAWRKRIEPAFYDVDPNTVTMAQISQWRQDIEDRSGIDAAHKALKVWRAFWRVMKALRYTQLSDPSEKVRNRAPPPRAQRFSYGEAMRIVKAAWRAGYRGVACITVIAWDTRFQPQDCRTLRRRHLGEDPKTGRLILDRTGDGRGKTGVAVIGTLSRFGDWVVRRYLAELGTEHHGESFLFRMRSGVPYGQSRLGGDFAAVRELALPGDARQLRDMRRSGVMEVFTGGGHAEDVSEKFGNTIEHSGFLFRTYNPVDIEKVRQADSARLEGRRRKNKN